MQSEWRQEAFFGEHRLRLEYSRGGGSSGGPAPDWECPVCAALNFGRYTMHDTACCCMHPSFSDSRALLMRRSRISLLHQSA